MQHPLIKIISQSVALPAAEEAIILSFFNKKQYKGNEILLHQGESNTNDKEWPAKVKGVYENLLRDLNLKAEEVPLIAGEVVHAEQKGVCASMNKIISELPKTISTAQVVSSQGCAALGDNLHFSPTGYRELGRRYAEKMLGVLGCKSAESK